MQDEQKKPSLTPWCVSMGRRPRWLRLRVPWQPAWRRTIPAPALSTMDEVVDDSMSTERMMALLSCSLPGVRCW